MDKQNYIYKEFLKASEECTGILREFDILTVLNNILNYSKFYII